MAEETQYTANTGMTTITTANTSLTGSGTLNTDIWDVITASSNGTLIKTITIKAQVNTTHGMVRLFIYDGTNTKLINEIEIPAVTKSSKNPAFEITIPVDYALKAGWKLRATTEKSETFNVIVEGLDWTYYALTVRPESSRYTANTGIATITTANTSLTGSGTLNTDIWDIITAASNGTLIQSITIKSQMDTDSGMVRLFLYDGTNTKLLSEIPVNAVTKSATAHSYSQTINFYGKGFALKSGWKLRATTEKTKTFNVIAEGLDWTYPA